MISDQKVINPFSKSILSSFEGTDLSRLIVPRVKDLNLLLGFSSTDKFQTLAKQVSESAKIHQSLLMGLAPQLTEMAELIEKQYKTQIIAFQSVLKQMQPFISNVELLSKQLSVLPIPKGLTSEALLTLSTFNSFQRFNEVYEEYNEINPVNLQDEKVVSELIAQNNDLLVEVNEIIKGLNGDTMQAGDIPELIYSYLVKRLPFLDKKKYGFIMLVISAVLFTYERYSDNQFEARIEVITDQQFEANKNIAKIDQQVESISEMDDRNLKFQNDVNSKLDSMIGEMRNQAQKK